MEAVALARSTEKEGTTGWFDGTVYRNFKSLFVGSHFQALTLPYSLGIMKHSSSKRIIYVVVQNRRRRRGKLHIDKGV